MHWLTSFVNLRCCCTTCWPRGPRHAGLTSNDDMRGNTGHSSVGRAPNCRRTQQSDAPWCGSALPAIWGPMSDCESKLAKHRAHPDLNQGPADLRSAALTTELCTHEGYVAGGAIPLLAGAGAPCLSAHASSSSAWRLCSHAGLLSFSRGLIEPASVGCLMVSCARARVCGCVRVSRVASAGVYTDAMEAA